ncbi:MAG: biotin transporter BioY [Acutalibacteraceae bacterium]|nr:biotin transporter BioY [Acutalibacteraceae bacterium]
MKKSIKTADACLAALFTAVIAVISQISVIMPTGVPITFQTFVVALCGFVLGTKLSLASVLTYILAGAVGLPVFSGFRGGVQHIFGATGGFIIGFLALALFCGIAGTRSSFMPRLFIGIIGLIICNFIGVVQFAAVSSVGLIEAFLTASVPFLIKDIILFTVAVMFSYKIKSLIIKIKK